MITAGHLCCEGVSEQTMIRVLVLSNTLHDYRASEDEEDFDSNKRSPSLTA